MRIMKSAALVLPALLLAGCSLADVKTAVLPVENTATIETAPTAAPQTLTVYASDALAPAARAYAEAQGVTLTMTADAAAADLLLTDHAPGGSLLDVTSDTLLAAAAALGEKGCAVQYNGKAARGGAALQHPGGKALDIRICFVYFLCHEPEFLSNFWDFSYYNIKQV